MATQPVTNNETLGESRNPVIPFAALGEFFRDAMDEATHGSRAYHVWMAVLTLIRCCWADRKSVV